MPKRSRTSRKLQSSWLVLPIAVVCAVVGVVAATKLRQSMAEIDAMRSWVEVPAIIRHADLKITASHDRGPPRTDSGSRLRRRFELVTAYDYVYTGRRHSGNRLSVYGNSETGDTMSRFLSNAYLELRRKRISGEPFRCFVNPNRPSESILFRQLRWATSAAYALFATLFGALGFALSTLILVVAWRRLRRRNPGGAEAPWLQRADWATGKIVEHGGTAVALPVLAVACAWWWFAMWPFFVRLPEIFAATSNPLVAATLLFPTIGSVLSGTLIYQFVKRLKFGASTVELDGTPGTIGGTLSGMVRIPRRLCAPEGFRLTLKSMENADADDPLWKKTLRVTNPARDKGGESIALPFVFEIPDSAQETSPSDARRQVKWRLEATAVLPGVDYDATFDVPVFKSPENGEPSRRNDRVPRISSTVPSRDVMLASAGIYKSTLPDGGVRLVFGAARNVEVAVPFTAATILWGGAIGLALHSGWESLAIAFAAVELLLLWWTARLWFHRSSVDASAIGLSTKSGMFGIARRRYIPADQIEQISDEYDNIVANLIDMKQHTIGRLVEGELSRRAVVKELTSALRIRKSEPTTADAPAQTG